MRLRVAILAEERPIITHRGRKEAVILGFAHDPLPNRSTRISWRTKEITYCGRCRDRKQHLSSNFHVIPRLSTLKLIPPWPSDCPRITQMPPRWITRRQIKGQRPLNCCAIPMRLPQSVNSFREGCLPTWVSIHSPLLSALSSWSAPASAGCSPRCLLRTAQEQRHRCNR